MDTPQAPPTPPSARAHLFACRSPQAGRAAGDGSAPLDAFIALQRQLGHRLTGLISNGLAALGRVLRNQGALTAALLRLGSALVADEVPAEWDALWEGPATPADYCQASGAGIRLAVADT